jgi:peroxiredoxin
MDDSPGDPRKKKEDTMKNTKPWIILTVAVALVALAVVAAPQRTVAAQTAKIGTPALDFTLADQDGAKHRLADYQGKIVVLEWTSNECPFVKRHYTANTMETLAKQYESKGVVWLAIDSSHFVDAKQVKTWQQEQNFAYPTLLDPAGTVGQAYRAKTTPHLFVIDTKGVLIYDGAIDDAPRNTANATRNYVSQALDATLAGQAVNPSKTRPYGCSVKYKK